MNLLSLYIRLAAGCAAVFASIFGIAALILTGDSQIGLTTAVAAGSLAFPGALLALLLTASASSQDTH
jgi:hypothetical protein